MSTFQLDDMVQGVKNFIEAAGIQEGDRVLFLADTRSDQASLQACTLGLKMIGANPIVLLMDHLARYSRVPDEAIGAAAHTDVIVLTWPVFITAGLNTVRKARTPTSDFDPSTLVPGQPKLVYLECAPGTLASSYAHFPNELLWALAKRVKEIALKGKKFVLPVREGRILFPRTMLRNYLRCKRAPWNLAADAISPGDVAVYFTAQAKRTALCISIQPRESMACLKNRCAG